MDTNTADTEPTVYRIPDRNLADLTAKFARLERRAAKLGVPAPGFTVTGTDEVVEYLDGRYRPTSEAQAVHIEVHTFHLVTVHGDAPKYAGWQLRAVIDRDLESDGPNVVHAADGAAIDPAWRVMGDTCDHCAAGVARGRKKLVAVQHDDGTVKVVGTTCLRDFLGHLSPEHIASWAEVICGLDDLMGGYEDDEPGTGGERRHMPARYLAFVAAEIRENGWLSRTAARATFSTPTSDAAAMNLDDASKGRTTRGGSLIPTPTDDDQALADKALAWAEGLPVDGDGNDYLANLRAVAGKQGWRHRDLGIGASMIAAYQRHVEKLLRVERERAAQANSRHVGEKGGKVTATATVTRVTVVDGYAYHSPPAAWVTFITDDGALLEWKASKAANAPEQGARVTVTGTVKEHGTAYNSDAPMTKLTRCKWTPAEADAAAA